MVLDAEKYINDRLVEAHDFLHREFDDLSIPYSCGYKHEEDAQLQFRKMDSPLAFLDLTIEERKALLEWIFLMLEPIKATNHDNTSYGLKHSFEDAPSGFYIFNGAMKGALCLMGYRPSNTGELNWCFNISKKSVKKLYRLNNGQIYK